MEDRALVRNAADPEQVEKAAKKEKRGREQEVDDIKFILSSAQGRRFYWRLLERCGVYSLSFRAGQPDQTAYLEGHRNIGLTFLNDLMTAEPEAYLKMMKEKEINDV